MKNDDINWNRNHHKRMRQFILVQKIHLSRICWQMSLMKIMLKVEKGSLGAKECTHTDCVPKGYGAGRKRLILPLCSVHQI